MLTFSSGLCGVAYAADEPVDAAAAVTPRIPTEIEASLNETDSLLAEAERVLGLEPELREQQAAIDTVKSLPPGPERTSLLERLSGMFRNQQQFEKARETALSIDPAADLQRARSLVLLADAERSLGTVESRERAWWTLREAGQIARTLPQREDVIAIYREIGTVERRLITDDQVLAAAHHSPATAASLREAIDYGLPPRGYQEIDLLRSGGGPLREPAVIRHTYYYNGNRTFQGPRFDGGPMRVEVTHPDTGCPVTVDINMPSGAPIVVYEPHEIEYLFPSVTVELSFRGNGTCDVDYLNHDFRYPLLRRKIESRAATGEPDPLGRFGLPGPEIIPGLGEDGPLRNTIQFGVNTPLELGRRLPVISSFIDQSAPRIPGSLRQ